MNEILNNAAAQAPIVTIALISFIWLTKSFLHHLEKRDVVIESIAQEQNIHQDRATDAINKNSEVLGETTESLRDLKVELRSRRT